MFLIMARLIARHLRHDLARPRAYGRTTIPPTRVPISSEKKKKKKKNRKTKKKKKKTSDASEIVSTAMLTATICLDWAMEDLTPFSCHSGQAREAG